MMSQMNRRHQPKFDIVSILEQVPLLSGLQPNERKQLANGLLQKKFDDGETLMKEGDEGDEFFIIIGGQVEVLTSKGGRVATLEGGDYAGEQALLQRTRRNATLRATCPTICLVCNQKLFKQILGNNTSVKFAKREAKRNAFMTALNDDVKLDAVKDDKTEEQIEWLLDCVESNLLFANLDFDQRTRVVRRMELIDVKKGVEIIAQGDEKATTFYVVHEGTLDVLVDNVKVLDYTKGGCFGELALLYDAPRAATVLATSDCKVWEVDRKAFRYEVTVFARSKVNERIQFLQSVPLFKPLLKQELGVLSDALEEKSYKKYDTIIKEGEKGDRFYVIQEGNLIWSKKDGQKGDLKPGQFFGERALRTKEPRAATIKCSSEKVRLLEMTAQDFNDLLGPIIDLIDSKIMGYERSKQQLELDKQKQLNVKKLENEKKLNSKKHKESSKTICKLHEFQTIGILGKGGFGLVTLVKDPYTKQTYALKAIKKFQVVELELEKHIISEKRVMDVMNSQFLVNLHKTFKDKLRVYFLLDVCLGGELFTILRSKRYFNEPTARFYAACVIEAFEYMHSMDIIYRDLKPENLVLDSNGYLKVTDFGFAKFCKDKTFTLCGTPDYLCPEIVTGQGHGKGVDWWTLGVLIYEMLASFPPFVADDPIDTYRKIIRGRIRFPRYFSNEVRSLIKQLLHNKPTKRLGVLRGGAKLIKKHDWYKDWRWDMLLKGTMPAPIVNKVRDPSDISNFAQVDPGDEDARPIAPEQEFDDEF